MGCACLARNDVNEIVQFKKTKFIINTSEFNNIDYILNTNNNSSIENRKKISHDNQKEKNRNTVAKTTKNYPINIVISEKETLKNNYKIFKKTSPQKAGPILTFLEKSFNMKKKKSKI